MRLFKPTAQALRIGWSAIAACALLGGASAWAEDEATAPPPGEARFTYALGGAVLAAPTKAELRVRLGVLAETKSRVRLLLALPLSRLPAAS